MSTTLLPRDVDPNESEGPQILGVVISTTIVALITVCLRLYVRIRMARSMGIDVSNFNSTR